MKLPRRISHWRGRTVALAVASAVLAVLVGVSAILLTRPKPPPPSDPKAGEHAAAFCLDGIKKAIAERLITASITAAGFDGEGLVTSVEYASDTVNVVYQWQSGRYEEASYDFATFFTRIVGRIRTPETRIFGMVGPAWLACTEAIQYYEQEKGKEVAAGLQRWIFGSAGSPEPSTSGSSSPAQQPPLAGPSPSTSASPAIGTEATPKAHQTSPAPRAPSPASPPAPSAQLQIQRVWTRDGSGTDKAQFVCGDAIEYTALVRNTGTVAVHATIDFAADNSERSLYHYRQEVDVQPGTNGYYSPSTIPFDAAGDFVTTVDVTYAGTGHSEGTTTFTVSCAR